MNISRHSAETLSPYEKIHHVDQQPQVGTRKYIARKWCEWKSSSRGTPEQRQPARTLCTKPSTATNASHGLGFTWNNFGDNSERRRTQEVENAGPRRPEGELPRLRKAHKFTTRYLGKAGHKREIAMPATSAISPPGIPGTIQKEGEKRWKRLWISCRYRFDKRRQNPNPKAAAEKQICLCSGLAGGTLPRLHGELQTRSKVQPRLKRKPAPYSHIYPVPPFRIARLCKSHGRTLDRTIILPVLEASRHHPFG